MKLSAKNLTEIKQACDEIIECAEFIKNNPTVPEDEDGGQLYEDNIEAIEYELDDLRQFT